MKNIGKKIFAGCALVIVVVAGVVVWKTWFGATRIAFVNYQATDLGQIARANDNPHIHIEELPVEDIGRLRHYDMVFINGMGLRITGEQREYVKTAAGKKLPIFTTAATNPANNIVSIDSVAHVSLRSYLVYGGRSNYRNMLLYVRREVDGKRVFAPKAGTPITRETGLLHHFNPLNPEDDDLEFNSIAEYRIFLQDAGIGTDGPAVIVTGVMGESADLVRGFEDAGCTVYAVRNLMQFIRGGHADSTAVAAVINMAHGRLGDEAVGYFKKQNIPLFVTLNVNEDVEEWENDPMGMSGGFLSQSVVTPEIDGAIRPYVVFGYYRDDEGLPHVKAIPSRLEDFVETVKKYIELQSKPNSEKKVAIYYYKGPGQNALTASGMEVAPSLYNLLLRLKNEGYKVEDLPSSAAALAGLIQHQGAVYGTYAEGAFNEYMKKGNPEIVSREQYESWVAEALRPEKYAEVTAAFGDFPGSYMATEDGSGIGVTRIQFGNVVLLPQPAAGAGDDAFAIVHGTDAAPPHVYIASYLWTRFGFGADALIHFGTHGSLEYTPRKQVALSENDWPDRLVGTMPHLYVYTIGNVGEAMIAKRRSYAGIQSHLTPPFMESSLRGTYKELSNAIDGYYKLYEADSPDARAVEEASLKVKKLAVQMGLHRDLGLDSLLTEPYSEAQINRLENFAEEIVAEKVTGQLYTLGEPYEAARIVSSVYAMTVDPVAYSMLALDKQRGKATADAEKHKAQFNARYMEPARQLVRQLLAYPSIANDNLVCKAAGITQEELDEARDIRRSQEAPNSMMSMMMSMAGGSASSIASAMDGMGNMGGDSMEATTGSSPGTKSAHKMPGKEMMARMGKNMNPEKAIAMARKMGASDEAIARMEAAMKAMNEGDSEGEGHPMADSLGMPDGSPDTATGASIHTKSDSAAPSGMEKMAAMLGLSSGRTYTKEQIYTANAILEVERTILNVDNYRKLLMESPEAELASIVNALNGGYTEPSPGGDLIANPNTLPTGRNLYGINAEATPSEAAWEKGKALADNTIALYRERHNDSIPRKVSYTLWSGEFIETEGATIAQVLYMLGVEPIRDAFGRVTDLRLIPSKELGRPRIDVVVQTSGQLRDLAASRLFLINRAVEMAAASTDDEYENQVATGVVESERMLVEKGVSPKEAREISSFRVFGAVNGGYGTGIQGMVMSGDRWEEEGEIADVYLNNMNAFYGSEQNWETVRQFALESALTRTDAVIQPRQSNTWGALSLDHVYEFMGGMNLAVRNVTGKDPDAYLSDYRNRNNVRMQEVKEAIGVESRSTIFNPEYIKEKMKGDAGGASSFAEIIQNTYGWNVMKPAAIDNEMWDEIYEVYVKDKFGLGVRSYFSDTNPAALQEITAVMLETVRKGMWDASEQQIADIAALHTELVKEYQPSCSGFVCDNAKLRKFIAEKSDPATAEDYTRSINNIREKNIADADNGIVMKREEMSLNSNTRTKMVNGLVVGLIVLIFIVASAIVIKRRRQ